MNTAAGPHESGGLNQRPPIDEQTVQAHASPSVRHLARELGVDLRRIKGSGRKNRVLKEDVNEYARNVLILRDPPANPADPSLSLSSTAVDFRKFGPIESVELKRVHRFSRHRSAIPCLTQHDEADITDAEEFCRSLQSEASKQRIKLTVLAFVLKASAKALRHFPDFNSSLGADAVTLVRKNYYHIGVTVDTPDGLVTPVLRDADSKGVFQLAREVGEVSMRARAGDLSPNDLEGGSFSITNLGSVGGTAFTPSINAPEVATLGVSRASIRPVYHGGQIIPRLLLPLSLSYDHRVIDEAVAARFMAYLRAVLGDIRRLAL